MGLAINAANDIKSTVLLGSISHQIYNHLMCQEEFKSKDFSSVFKWLNENGKTK